MKHNMLELIRKIYFAPMFSRVIRKHISEGNTVLEAGSGSGEISRLLAKDFYVTAVDNSIEAIGRAQYPTFYADIESLPFDGKMFYAVFNQGVMEHFEEDEFIMILKEFKRVAKITIIIVPANTSLFKVYCPYPDKNEKFYKPKELEEVMLRVFDNVKVYRLPQSFYLSIVGIGE